MTLTLLTEEEVLECMPSVEVGTVAHGVTLKGAKAGSRYMTRNGEVEYTEPISFIQSSGTRPAMVEGKVLPERASMVACHGMVKFGSCIGSWSSENDMAVPIPSGSTGNLPTMNEPPSIVKKALHCISTERTLSHMSPLAQTTRSFGLYKICAYAKTIRTSAVRPMPKGAVITRPVTLIAEAAQVAKDESNVSQKKQDGAHEPECKHVRKAAYVQKTLL